MAINKKSVDEFVESVKHFFENFMSPNMTIEDISEVAAMRLDDVISKNQAAGLTYSAGKLRIIFVNDNQFHLEFEMYFQDADGKWHKLANESEPRDMKLLEEGAQKTLKALKTIEFPIEAPKKSEQPAEEKSEAPVEIDITPEKPAEESKSAEESKPAEEKSEGVKLEKPAQ